MYALRRTSTLAFLLLASKCSAASNQHKPTAGLVIGCIVVVGCLVIILGLIAWMVHRRRRVEPGQSFRYVGNLGSPPSSNRGRSYGGSIRPASAGLGHQRTSSGGMTPSLRSPTSSSLSHTEHGQRRATATSPTRPRDLYTPSPLGQKIHTESSQFSPQVDPSPPPPPYSDKAVRRSESWPFPKEDSPGSSRSNSSSGPQSLSPAHTTH